MGNSVRTIRNIRSHSSSIWLLDLDNDLPSAAQLDGFDVSLDQCPTSQWLPPKITMHTWNVFENPPQEFVEAFDVVHVRLITFIIKNNDPRPVLSNLQKILSMLFATLLLPLRIFLQAHEAFLEPSGYIQWDEVDSVNCYVKAADSSVKTDAVERLLQQLRGVDE